MGAALVAYRGPVEDDDDPWYTQRKDREDGPNGGWMSKDDDE